ncbi:MAG: hypothetical protein AAF494_14585 [Pseudomonadota bacterium]
MQSARIHDLRIMLMVNALKCRTSAPATLRKYGQLLNQRSEELTYHGRQVKSALVDRYGPRQGQLAFDRYETRISNYHSNIKPSREQCEDVMAFMKLAGRANYAELETLSKLVTNRAIETCLVPEGQSGFTTAAIAPAPAQSATSVIVRRAANVQEPEIVDGIPTFSAADAAPASAPEPLETVAVPEPAPAIAVADPVPEPEPAGSSEDDKLGQAINALDAAAAALRDLRQEPSSSIN